MRRATKGANFIKRGKILQGISFGTDYCKEHESGLKKIKDLLNIRDSYLISENTIKDFSNIIYFSHIYKNLRFGVITLVKNPLKELTFALRNVPEEMTDESAYEDITPIAVAWDGDIGFQIIFSHTH